MGKRLVFGFLPFIIGALLFADTGMCTEMSKEELHRELRQLKDRIDRLEMLNKEIDKKAKKTAEVEPEGSGFLEILRDRITFGGLVEVGAGYRDTKLRGGRDVDSSDINLTTVELGLGVNLNEWTNVELVFLYEDPFENDEEGSFDLDVGAVTFGNPEKSSFYLTAGKFYIPFGACLTHLPDDPMVDQPMALLLGETSEKAVQVGFVHSGIAVSGYAFNSDIDESVDDNTIESFGFDVNYTLPENSPLELCVGASYISNIASSEGLTEFLDDNGVTHLHDYVGGFDAYLQLGFRDLFLEAEYMTALEKFDPTEIVRGNGDGAKPSVWNIEAGYNWDWGKNLEIVLKYAGSDETEALGFSRKRFGIGFNQGIFEGDIGSVTGSVAYFRDEYHADDADGRDKGNSVYAQIAIEF